MSRPKSTLPCKVAGCEGKIYAHGFCNKHWARLHRNGTLEISKLPNGSRLKWVKENVAAWAKEECLIFPFPVASHGYGSIRVNGCAVLVHRYVCELAHGKPPSVKHDAAHSCGTKPCVNRSHLRWATRKENEADKLLHGRTPCGTAHVHSKLTDKEVLQIRKSRAPQRQIAAKYGIVQQTVSDIKCRRRWAWL